MAIHVLRLGNVEIMVLSDGMLEFNLCNFFLTIPHDQWDPYQSHLTEEHRVRFNLGSYLIPSDGRTISWTPASARGPLAPRTCHGGAAARLPGERCPAGLVGVGSRDFRHAGNPTPTSCPERRASSLRTPRDDPAQRLAVLGAGRSNSAPPRALPQ